MNNLLIAKIESLPKEQQKEVESYVQFLVDKFIVNKPIEQSIVEKRKQAFGVLDQKVFSGSEDF
jgi:hypothetical protein